LFILATAAIGLLGTLSGGWAEQAILRVYPEYETRGQTELLSRIATPLVIRAILAGCSIALVGLSTAVGLGWLPEAFTRYLPPTILLLALRPSYGVLRAVLQASRQSGVFVQFEIALAIGPLLLGLLLIGGLGVGMHARLWAEAIVLGVILPVAWRIARRNWGQRRLHVSAGESKAYLARRFVRYGAPMAGWLVSFQVMNVVDRYMIEAFLGASAVGIYGAVYTLVERVIGLLFVPLLMATYPILVKVWAEEGPSGASRDLSRVMEWFVAIALPVFGFGSLLGGQLVDIVLPSSYGSGKWLIPWFLGGFLVWQFAMYAHKGLEFAQATGRMLAAVVVSAVANIAANVLLIPTFGLAGAAMATAGSFTLYLGLVWNPGRQLVPWTLSSGRLLRLTASTLLGTLIVGSSLLRIDGIAGSIFATIAGLVVYLMSFRTVTVLSERLRGSRRRV
jgi:O-antigen/teichoic acid export membrane protein